MKKESLKGILLGVLIFGVAFSGFAETIYVTNLNDTLAGSAPNGLQTKGLTLSQAIEKAKPGDIVRLSAGDTIVVKKTIPVNTAGISILPNTTIKVDPSVDTPFNVFDICLNKSNGKLTFEDINMIGNTKGSGAAFYIHKKDYDVVVDLHSVNISDFHVDSKTPNAKAVIYDKDSELRMSDGGDKYPSGFSNNTTASGILVYNENGKVFSKETNFNDFVATDTAPSPIFNTCDTPNTLMEESHNNGAEVTLRFSEPKKTSSYYNF